MRQRKNCVPLVVNANKALIVSIVLLLLVDENDLTFIPDEYFLKRNENGENSVDKKHTDGCIAPRDAE